MAAEKVPNHKRSKEQPALTDKPSGNDIKEWGKTTYQPEFAQLAFDLLSKSNEAKTKAHLCQAFNCSKPTLLLWMKQNPEFESAVNAGLEIGKARWRDRLADHAFSPAKEVNNGLIKLLSANVYGIKEEPSVVFNNTQIVGDPEEIMQKRGIPIPDIEIPDLNENEESNE